MRIDGAAYSGPCQCGHVHEVSTRAAVIESGCLADFEEHMAACGIAGRRCVLCDTHTAEAAGSRRPGAQQEIVLDAAGLHANEVSTAAVLERLAGDTQVIVAVGSGTIHDIARYCAHARGLCFVSVPTAASVDGFCSSVAAMTWHGFKKTLPAVAPALVVADTELFKNAPAELVKSGVGDILAKYTALADWRIAALLTGEYLCPRIERIVRSAADSVAASVPGLLAGAADACEKVMYALLMSGIAMQMMGNSRPASGAEHHISHLVEERPAQLQYRFPALHGEKTGVGALLAARVYHRLADRRDIAPFLTEYHPADTVELERFFGGSLAPAILRENQNDCLAAVQKERIAAAWPRICEIVRTIPAPERLDALLQTLGAKRTLEDIGLSQTDLPAVLTYSPYVRNRLTLMRVRRMMPGA